MPDTPEQWHPVSDVCGYFCSSVIKGLASVMPEQPATRAPVITRSRTRGLALLLRTGLSVGIEFHGVRPANPFPLISSCWKRYGVNMDKNWAQTRSLLQRMSAAIVIPSFVNSQHIQTQEKNHIKCLWGYKFIHWMLNEIKHKQNRWLQHAQGKYLLSSPPREVIYSIVSIGHCIPSIVLIYLCSES